MVAFLRGNGNRDLSYGLLGFSRFRQDSAIDTRYTFLFVKEQYQVLLPCFLVAGTTGFEGLEIVPAISVKRVGQHGCTQHELDLTL